MYEKIILIDHTVEWSEKNGSISTEVIALVSKYATVRDPRGLVGRYIFRDDNSKLEPHQVYNLTKDLINEFGVDNLEFCAGNKYGLATANSLAAMKAGIRVIHTSVGGAIEGSGAAMEEVLMCAKHFLGVPNLPDTKNLAEDAARILAAIGIQVPPNKAIIGRDIFAHESGIHVDGVLKNPKLYEVFEPEEVGLKRRLVVGKHSGRKTVYMKLLDFGIEAPKEVHEAITKKAKKLAITQKHALSDAQLLTLYDDYMKGARVYCLNY